MLKKVKTDKKIRPSEFLKFVSKSQKEQILKLAKQLKGKKILHLNATAEGGGVAEILKSLIPYLGALKIDAEWYALDPNKAGREFFSFTNKLHNCFQGGRVNLTSRGWQIYKNVNKKVAQDLDKMDYDILVINDPQPLFCVNYLENIKKQIYYSHIDTSEVSDETWQLVAPVIKKYGFTVFSNKEFISSNFPKEQTKVFTPAIDPLSEKQKIVSKIKAKKYFKEFGINEKKPLVVQVSRFDVWKNPLGVIEAFRVLQHTCPQVQLALVGFEEAKDNPEAERVFKDVSLIAKGDPNIFLFFDPSLVEKGISEFTMMIQNAADIIVQNSIKEGFGLTVTEAMWKKKPIIGGPASGIRRQIKHNKNGYIVENSEELAMQIIELLKDLKKTKKIGENAKETVMKNFLFPRLVLDHLDLYKEVLE